MMRKESKDVVYLCFVKPRLHMKNFLLTCLSLVMLLCIQAQENYWTTVDYSSLNLSGTQYLFPDKYEAVRLDYLSMKNTLFTAPLHDRKGNAETSPIEISLPMPDGTLENFKIVESPVYEEGFTTNNPGIKTFLAYNPNHPTWYTRLDLTPLGFHGMILGTDDGTVYIDPIMHLGDINHYFSYYKKDYKRTVQEMICELDDKAPISISSQKSSNTTKSFGSCELRTYRLALAATGEYTAFHGGTVANALAAQVTTMNRVNGIYERDFAIRMNIIGNNNLIIYTNGATDPYPNFSGIQMLDSNQVNIDAVIGTANYDIGHVFSTGGGGIAQLQSPCSSTGKARGVTGLPSPINDPFDVDYVCHEFGHQFGARHTFHSTVSNCATRNLGTAFEPGSGTTIMAYAGICPPHNVQTNSDDYFHGISMEEVGDFITSPGHTCPVTTPLINMPPSVSINSSVVNIPANTPFALTAFASDPNTANTLTYCWEQMDNDDSATPPVANSTDDGPMFRSFDPTTSPTRYFPNLPDVISGAATPWEVLPSVTRTMNFRVVVRDNAPSGGCNDHLDMTVNVVGTAGPFVVTTPNNAGLTLVGNSNYGVSWNVANTNVAPISCGTVNILISYDGGTTFPDTLASNVANDGNESVLIPNIGTNQGLIIVQCADGTFYDVSDNTFNISVVVNDFSFAIPNPNQTVCEGNNASYAINIGELGTFNNNVLLTAFGLPAGLSASFSANNQAPSFTPTLTISNTAAVAGGTYNFTVEATSSSGTKSLNVFITIIEDLTGPVNLLTPTNGATSVSTPVTFTWGPIAGALYDIEIATDAAFTNIINTGTGLTTATYTYGALNANNDYYWRVNAYNACDTISSFFIFTTANCNVYNSTNVPTNIPLVGNVSSTLDIVGTIGTINDVNVVSLSGTHSYIQDLTFTLTSPSATSVVLLDNICLNQNNFDIQFDDAAPNNSYPCPPTDGNAYIPDQNLAAFNGENANGTWTLLIEDQAGPDGGQLNAWGIEVCYDIVPCQPNFTFIDFFECDSAFVLGDWYTNDTFFDITVPGVAAGGCDSVYSYAVFLTPPDTTNQTIIACDSSLIGSTWYFTSQIISSTDTNQTGCDSTHIIDLTINSSSNTSQTLVACDSALVNSTWYFSSQQIMDTFPLGSSCDSIHTTDLTINNSSPITTLNVLSCTAGNVGSVTTTLTNAAGCDSVVVTNTTLGAGNSGINNVIACDSTQINGTWYFANTTFNDTLIGASSNGCDSIITNNVTINNSVTSNQTITTCDSAVIDGTTYTSSQTVTQNLTASNNCDSTHVITLIINNSVTTTSTTVACDSAIINGTTYFASQLVSNTVTGLNGCDSTHVVNLTINNSSPVTVINATTCNASLVGSVSQTLTNITGCDSVVTTNTTLLPSNTGSSTITACDSAQVNGTTYFASTTFNDTLIGGSSNGCDSIVSYTITINNSANTAQTIIACDSSIIDGTTYFTSQVITQNLTGANTCDSTHVINLTINNSVQTTTTLIACDSAIINGTTYFSSQQVSNTVVGSNGCDSTHVVDLTINNSSPVTVINQTTCLASLVGSVSQTFANIAGCDSVVTTNTNLINGNSGTETVTACDSVQVSGTWFFANTTFVDTLVGGANNGCDSITTYNITINNSVATNQVLISCDSATINGTTYFSSQVIPQTFTAANGCDSTHTIDLTINNSVQTFASLVSCDSAQIDGTWYFTSQIVQNTLTGVNNCDSVHVVNLTINNSSPVTVINQTSCDANQVGSNSQTFTNAAGCDSVVTTTTTLISGGSSNQTVTACDSIQIGGTWFFNTTSTVDTVFGGSANGCDSVVFYSIMINNGVNTNQNINACDSITINGINYTSSQVITQSFTANNGCDSTHTINLTISNAIQLTDVQVACDSLTWLDGITYTTSNNTATFIVGGGLGCDTVYTLDLTINNTLNVTQAVSACDSYTWIDGNTYFASTITPTIALTGSSGCDSIITLNLSILSSTAGTDVVNACGSYTWLDGNTYFASNNTATFTTTNSAGCDSLITLNLTISNGSTGVDVQTACDSYTWINGNTYVSPNNTATFTIAGGAANGCDSVVTLNLSLSYSEGHTYILTACDSLTWVNGVTYTSSIFNEVYIVPGATAGGCDSIYVLDLTIVPSGSGTDVITACGSYTWIDGITYTSSTTTPTFTVQGGNSNGCNAEMSLDLTILPFPSITIVDNNGTYEATPGLSNYQWYRNNQMLIGETNSTYTPTTFGGYTCETSNGSCTGVSNMIVRGVTTGIGTIEFEEISIYPNPAQDYLNIEVGQEELTSLKMFDVTGKLVRDLNVKQTQFYVGDYAKGMYFIELANEERRSLVKIILK